MNISKTTPTDISMKPGVVEHVHIGKNYSATEIEEYWAIFKEFRNVFSSSFKEMFDVDPFISIHEIKTYSTWKPVRKKLL